MVLLLREKNERLAGHFLATKKKLEEILFSTLPNVLAGTRMQLLELNSTIVQAYEDHMHTFFMMKYILRSEEVHPRWNIKTRASVV